MTKYCDPQQHQLNKLSHLWEGARDLYSKPQDESKVSVLEKEVTKLRHKLSKASKAHEVLGNQIKKIPQLETKVANLKHANAVQRSVHQAEVESYRAEVEAHRAEIELLLQEHTAQLEAKDFFYVAEKVRALTELQADYQAKLPALYIEQYDLDY